MRAKGLVALGWVAIGVLLLSVLIARVGEAKTADLVRAFAPYVWPLVTVAVIVTFRRAIRRVIELFGERIKLLTRFKAGPTEWEFTSTAAPLLADVSTTTTELLKQIEQLTSERDDALALAKQIYEGHQVGRGLPAAPPTQTAGREG